MKDTAHARRLALVAALCLLPLAELGQLARWKWQTADSRNREAACRTQYRALGEAALRPDELETAARRERAGLRPDTGDETPRATTSLSLRERLEQAGTPPDTALRMAGASRGDRPLETLLGALAACPGVQPTGLETQGMQRVLSFRCPLRLPERIGTLLGDPASGIALEKADIRRKESELLVRLTLRGTNEEARP